MGDNFWLSPSAIRVLSWRQIVGEIETKERQGAYSAFVDNRLKLIQKRLNVYILNSFIPGFILNLLSSIHKLSINTRFSFSLVANKTQTPNIKTTKNDAGSHAIHVRCMCGFSSARSVGVSRLRSGSLCFHVAGPLE